MDDLLYRVIHDPRALGIEGTRLTKKQIMSARRRGDVPDGMLFIGIPSRKKFVLWDSVLIRISRIPANYYFHEGLTSRVAKVKYGEARQAKARVEVRVYPKGKQETQVPIR